MVSQMVSKESCRASEGRDGGDQPLWSGDGLNCREGPCRARITVMEIRMTLAWLGEKIPECKGAVGK